MKFHLCLAAAGTCMVTIIPGAFASHPQILVTDTERPAIQAKLQSAAWAKTGYAALKARIDPLVERTQTDPKWVSSRLMMNWDTHYTTPLVRKSCSVGGEGRAPVPTPRFAGARNWANDYSRPAKLEDWQPYNDQGGKIRLFNGKTKQMEWVDPGITGRNIEAANEQIMGYAADAAFVYWLTGDEKYARFAGEILWTYMEGFSYMQPPEPVDPDPKMMQIIGPTSFEVIHENLVIPTALAYDFLKPYLEQQGRDTKIIQVGLQRWAQRVVDGGGRDGNWNLNQAMMITYAGLALEDNAAYPDGHGRQYFVDIVLNADLPAQKGLTRVIKEGFDPQSALWPEAAGYGFGSAAQMVELSLLLSADPAGRELLTTPLLSQSLLNQGEMLYPNGLSNGVGDTTNTRMRSDALENLISWARQSGDTALEAKLTPYLRREIESGNYTRNGRSDLYSLTHYVPELKAVDAAPSASRSFFFSGLNIYMQRNLAAGGQDPAHSLAAALYGTEGGHVSSNGLAIELFGAGYILGADPGRGASYWTADHAEYYSQPPAHNTVIVNGLSNYPAYGDKHIAMRLESQEPAPGQPALSPNIGFARGSFRYNAPVAAEQQRTLVLIRTGPKSGFYWDVFRSRGENPTAGFQDYMYHNMGSGIAVNGISNLAPSSTLAQPGLLKGYGYFKNEKSASAPGDWRASWTMDLPDGSKPAMDLWMLGQPERTVFTVDAPANNTIREGLPASIREKPMPTIIVRQQGEAWNRPFVSVYEPYLGAEKPTVTSVRAGKAEGEPPSLAAAVVEGQIDKVPFRALMFQDAAPAARKVEGTEFQGEFGVCLERNGEVEELYLGRGRRLGAGLNSIRADADDVRADLRRTPHGWTYSASAPVHASLTFELQPWQSDLAGIRVNANLNAPVRIVELPSGKKVIATDLYLPAAENKLIEVIKFLDWQ